MLATGNPTRIAAASENASGRLHRWKRHQVDGAGFSLTDKHQIARWAADYGDDSDFFRVRVKGEFPRGGPCSSSTARRWRRRRPVSLRVHLRTTPVMGVDCARGGDDQSTIWYRAAEEMRAPYLRSSFELAI